MRGLVDEFETLKQYNFVLDFDYPDNELLKSLRVVHCDLSPQEKQLIEKGMISIENILAEMEKGNFHPEDFDNTIRDKLKFFFGDRT